MAFLNVHNDDAGDIDVLLAKWVTREAEEQEYAAVEDWIAVSEENKMVATQIYTVWDKSRGLGFSGVTDPGAAWEKFQERISKMPVPQSTHRPVRKWVYLAVAVCAIILSFFIWNGHERRPATPVVVQIASGAVSRTDSLPGVVVTLYPRSAVAYDSPYAASQRPISLTGDAFFSVRPDSGRIFRVSVRGLIISGTATRFSVASRPGATEISVYRGIIVVSEKMQQDRVSAHEKLIVPLVDSPWVKKMDSAALKHRR